MLITIVVQILFVLLALTIIGYWKPVTGGGVFLLFLVSQLLVITRLTLKTWRYGCITFLSEVNEPPENISNLLQK
jgi:hypothetical protein